MEHDIATVFSDGFLLQLSALLAVAVFFLMVGIREVRDGNLQGFLFLTLAMFFLAAHVVQLIDLTTAGPGYHTPICLNAWTWLAAFLAPALIFLYLLRGLFGWVMSNWHEGLIKVFFGLTLLCFVYMIGYHWPADVRGILTFIWAALFFKVELEIVNC